MNDFEEENSGSEHLFAPLPRSDLHDADADLNSRDMPFVSVHRWCERDKEREPGSTEQMNPYSADPGRRCEE